MHGLRELLRIVIVDLVVVEIEQVALPIMFENRAEDPAVSVIIGELGVLKLRIQFRDLVEKSFVAPKSARSGGLGIFHCRSEELSIRRIVLFLRIHQLAVRFLVPPGVTEIRVHEEISLMHVAIHALARRNRAGELVHDRMSALGFRNRFVSGETQTLMSKLVPPAGIRWRTIVGVNNVAGRATARSIIARM